MKSNFTWVPFYIELADKILSYKNDRITLIAKVREAHSLANKELPIIESDNNNIPDIDPFTVFALFNRGKQGTETRIELCTGYKKSFGIEANVPSDFDGIPMYNYNQYCFYRYLNDSKRDNGCFTILWDLFEEAIKLSKGENKKSEFTHLFDEAIKLSLIGLSKLTIALFQIRPNTFVNLDNTNVSYIESTIKNEIKVASGEDYLKLCDEINDYIHKNAEFKTLPEFSSRAYDVKMQKNDDDGWWPSKKEYDPQITKEQWLDFMNNSGRFNDNYKHLFSSMIDNGCQATCAQLSRKYGNTYAHYNMTANQIAHQIVEYTNCPLYIDENGKTRYWTILFVGKDAEKEAPGTWIWKLRDELYEALMEFGVLRFLKPGDTMNKITDAEKNTILYGPPGTGKTYNTVIYAVAIIENKTMAEISAEDYTEVLSRYNKYKSDGLVEFTTFHQSYGYEEFIEGIKPVMDSENDEQKEVEYEIVPGLFKSFCDKAGQPILKKSELDIGLNSSPAVWKVSLGGTGDNPTRTECFENNHIRVGFNIYGKDISSDTDFSLDGGKNVLNALIYKMKIGDIVLSCYSATTIDAIGIVSGEYEWHDEYDDFKRVRKVNWIVKNIREDISEANGSNMTLATVYRMKISVADVMNIIRKYSENADDVKNNDKNYVFIIDEINRGNISKIFGELITLIEPSKRLGQSEGVKAKLPYSKTLFGVPDNVYIIGTMNTADRSIAAIDTALRRRFRFKEMQPDPEVLDGIIVEGVSIKDMLIRMNKRISVLFDREHTIGHAYFIPIRYNQDIKTLADIFENNIIPLLQEYFYDDYEKIRMVLGDNNAAKENQFIIANDVNISELFGNSDFDIDDCKSYEINYSAFTNIEAYKHI